MFSIIVNCHQFPFSGSLKTCLVYTQHQNYLAAHQNICPNGRMAGSRGGECSDKPQGGGGGGGDQEKTKHIMVHVCVLCNLDKIHVCSNELFVQYGHLNTRKSYLMIRRWNKLPLPSLILSGHQSVRLGPHTHTHTHASLSMLSWGDTDCHSTLRSQSTAVRWWWYPVVHPDPWPARTLLTSSIS